jgi:hypothetical protein
MKFPYIGKSLKTNAVILFYGQAKGAVIEASSSALRGVYDGNCINEEVFKNITREYLANTYGKIESKEHAEFIAKLAKANGIRVCNTWYKDAFFCFFTDCDNLNVLLFSLESTARDSGEKLITIPLPPKTLAPTATPEEEFEMQQTEKNNGVKVNVTNNTNSVVQIVKSDDEKVISVFINDLPNNGDNLLSAGESKSNLEEMVYDANKKNAAIKTLENIGYKFCGGEYWKPPIGNLPDFIGKTKEEAESKDWPQVGDEVLYNGSSNRFKSIKGAVSKVIAKYSFDGIDYITIKNESDGIFAMVFGSWIKKPKTPEEELSESILKFLESGKTYDRLAEAIIKGEIKGLTYKP